MALIVLTVCTCRRPQALLRLLLALREVVIRDDFSVIVVENDAGLEGKAICQTVAQGYPWPLSCVVESERGISHARNRAVAAALERRPDCIAMLDDDQWPSPTWLDELTSVHTQTGADIVGGPVVPVPAQPPRHWAALARHYGIMRELPNGAPCMLYSCSNVLVRRQCFEGFDQPFDRAFDRIGGEDLHFIRRLDRRGIRSCWAANAVVFEEVPADRLAREWLLMRQFRRGYINVAVDRCLDPSPVSGAYRLTRSLGVLVRGAVSRLHAALRREPDRLLAEMYWQYALGRMREHYSREHPFGLWSHGGPSRSPRDS